MTITAYDPVAAAEHGYRVVTAADGTQSSVPVTEQAKRDEARAGRSSANGTCGTAWLTVTPVPAQGAISIYTAYSLTRGRASFGHLWNVSGQSRLGAPFTESFSGMNDFDSSWSATHVKGLYGFSHGSASLHVSNHAKLTNGGICTAKVVVDAW